jgi:hypothetical protein
VKGGSVPTVSRSHGRDQQEPDHRPGVAKTALTVAGASGGGITTILGAVAFGAIPVGLAYLAVSMFGLIMVLAMILAGIYIGR